MDITTSTKKWAFGIACTVFLTGALYAADSRWLQVASFKDYIVKQEQRDIKREMREVNSKLIELEVLLEYDENMSPPRRAILQNQKRVLERQMTEMELELRGLEYRVE